MMIIARNAVLKVAMLIPNVADVAKGAQCGAMKLRKNGVIIQAKTVYVQTKLYKPSNDP